MSTLKDMTTEAEGSLKNLAGAQTESVARFTSGPLHAGDETEDGGHGILIHSGHAIGFAYTQEDARLWAAAPDLLTALANLCDEIADTEDHGDGADDDSCSVCRAHQAARAAIHRATATGDKS